LEKMKAESTPKIDEAFIDRIATQMSGSSVLLTGATGLVGTSILNVLSGISHTTSFKAEIFTSSTSDLKSLSNFKILNPKHQILDLTTSLGEIAKRKYDFIIHAGGPAQPIDFMQRRKETYLVNSIVTGELLDLVENDGKFVFMSSSELYSGLTDDHFFESQIGTSLPSHPRACYIEGKRAGEMFVDWGRDDGMQSSSLRLSYTYGPGSKAGDTRVINQIIESAIKHGQIQLRDTGTTVRTNLYINDAAQMILSVLLNPLKSIYNIAGVKTATIKDIAELVAILTQSELILPSSDASHEIHAQKDVQLDIGAYIEDFGLPIFTDLHQGLQQTVEWQRINLYKGMS
jgi:nucleoside-diphosphate-sugar epimerase